MAGKINIHYKVKLTLDLKFYLSGGIVPLGYEMDDSAATKSAKLLSEFSKRLGDETLEMLEGEISTDDGTIRYVFEHTQEPRDELVSAA